MVKHLPNINNNTQKIPTTSNKWIEKYQAIERW
jgi:hypothetical protein